MPKDRQQIHVYLLPEEKQVLEAAAKRAGLALGPWLRSVGLLFAGLKEQVTRVGLATDAVKDALALVTGPNEKLGR